MNIINALNNREIAVAVWSIIVFLWALSISGVRHAIPNLLKAFFVKKIITPFIVMLLYVVILVIIFEKVGFWDVSALKDTILWTTGTAFVTFFSLNKVVNDENYFKNTILDNIKLVLILEFVVNLYSFGLIVELIVVPIASMIVILGVVAESKPEYKRVKVFLNYVLGLFGLVLLVYTFRGIFVDFQNFATIKNLRDFFLPVLFTLFFLPFIYFMALSMQYESLFTRVNFANKNSSITRYAKRKIFATCNISLSKLTKFSKNAGLPKINSKNDVLALIKKAQGK